MNHLFLNMPINYGFQTIFNTFGKNEKGKTSFWYRYFFFKKL